MALTHLESREIAARYALAWFDLALDQNASDAVGDDLAVLAGLIQESPELARLIANPVIDVKQKQAAMAEILAQGNAHGLTVQLIDRLIINKRLEVLADIAASYEEKLLNQRGELAANVTTARPLSDAQVEAVSAALAQASGKAIRLRQKVDPAIIGGIIVRLGSKMLDHSLSGALSRLEQSLKAGSK